MYCSILQIVNKNFVIMEWLTVCLNISVDSLTWRPISTGDGHDGSQQLEPNYHSEACQPANGGAAKGIVLTQQSVVFRFTTVCAVSGYNGLRWRCVWPWRCRRLDHRSRERPADRPPSLNHLRVTRFGKP